MCEQNIFKNCNILTYFSNLLELLINFSELAFHLLFNEIYFIPNLIPFYLFYKKILLYISFVFPELLLKFIFLLKKNDTFHFILKNFSPHRRRNKRKDYITGGDL